MQSLKFNPFGTSRLSKGRAIRQPSVSCAGRRNHVETRAALQDGRPLPFPKAVMTAAAGLSTVFLANPALADLDHSSVVNTAQQFGIAGVAMVTASAATYGGILLVQHMFKGFGGQQQQYRPHHNHRSTPRREGGNVPAFAFGAPSGTPSSTTLSFRQAPFKPSASPAAVPASIQSKSASKSEPSIKPPSSPEVSPAFDSSSASHELLASMDTTSEPAPPASAAAPHDADSLFTAARGKSLQAIFRHGTGCSGHSRAAIDFVSNLLSPIAEPASGSETALASSAAQPQSLAQKATESVSEFTDAAEAAGDPLEAIEKESMTADQQQAEYNARLSVIRREANRKAAEEARRHQLRQRALDHMQPASAGPQEQPVPAAVMQKARTLHGSQYLAGLATFLASLLAWLQAMWQRLVQTVTGQPRGRFAPSSA